MFSLFNSSRAASQPITLYLFEYGIDFKSRMTLTDWEFPVEHGGYTFQPVQIRHSNISSSGTLDNSSVDINTPFTNPLVELFRAYPPDGVVNVSIFRGEAEDPDKEFLPVWSGRILNFSVQVNEAKFTCEPVATSVRRPGLRRTYQYGCPHVLYGPQCKAVKTLVPAGVIDISGSWLTLPPGWNGPNPVQAFIKGTAEWTLSNGVSARRSILRVNGDTILLSGIPSELTIGSGVGLALGCGRNMSDCANLHNNIVNFGGQPWISLDNPMGTKNQFY